MAVNSEERAFRAWPVLTNCATNHQTITYGDLAIALNIHHRAVAHVLGWIQQYCIDEHLPPLTILVVNKKAGIPGSGFIATANLGTGSHNVYHYNWNNLGNPFDYAALGDTIESLAQKLIATPTLGASVFAQVKVRGPAQAIFRKVLMNVYQGECAFCRLSFEEALEAAHIIPWSEATSQQRLDPSNGLLLCSTHHKLFDTGYITLDLTGKVASYDPLGLNGPYSKVDSDVLNGQHGQRANLPIAVQHQPSSQALAHHHARFNLP